ncbi:MAG: hypothetical protein H0V81_13100, partial [Solirubrobacterales bacterium]|nr:hypothetical protein [Solirubrobacterales bacterium]
MGAMHRILALAAVLSTATLAVPAGAQAQAVGGDRCLIPGPLPPARPAVPL